MSNATIASRMLEIVADFERGRLPSVAIAQCMELHEPALEGIERNVRDRLHKLSVQIIEQDISPIEEQMLGIQASRNAATELKELLKKIE